MTEYELRWEAPIGVHLYLNGSAKLKGRAYRLDVYGESLEGNIVDAMLLFEDVQSYRCTYRDLISQRMFASKLMALVEVLDSAWLRESVEEAMSGWNDKGQLRHYLIRFDEGPCFEFLCAGFRVENRSTEPS